MRIFAGVSWGGASNDSEIVDNDSFQRFRWLFLYFSVYFFGNLEMRPALLYSDTQSVVGFSGNLKCMTLNDPEWLFRVKLCFLGGLSFENNCVKTNGDRHILSAAQIFCRDSRFWQYKFHVDIRTGCLEKSRGGV